MLELPSLQEVGAIPARRNVVYLSLSPAAVGTSQIGFSGRRPWILPKPETLHSGRADSKGRPSRFLGKCPQPGLVTCIAGGLG